MHDFHKLMEHISNEVEKIEERGLNTSNIETAYKLLSMYKNIKTIEGMEGYSEGESRTGYSQRRMYSRGYDRGTSYDGDSSYEGYSRAKANYRMDHSYAAKEGMMQNLEGSMEEMVERIKEMRRDADTQEERDMIDRYVNLIRK